jgi:hypothetical protein
MVKCVLISEEDGNITEEDINIKFDLYRVLKGTGTFIGQIDDVVIMKCDVSYFDLMENRNKLPAPYHEEFVLGPILLIRMDADAEPRDFVLSEFLSWYPRIPL